MVLFDHRRFHSCVIVVVELLCPKPATFLDFNAVRGHGWRKEQSAGDSQKLELLHLIGMHCIVFQFSELYVVE